MHENLDYTILIKSLRRSFGHYIVSWTVVEKASNELVAYGHRVGYTKTLSVASAKSEAKAACRDHRRTKNYVPDDEEAITLDY